MAQSEQTNGTGGLAKLLNQLNMPTLALILLMQGGNWWETKAGNDFNAREIERATQEIHELYPKLMQAIDNQNKMLQANADQLHNQGLMLENQQRVLDLLQHK